MTSLRVTAILLLAACGDSPPAIDAGNDAGAPDAGACLPDELACIDPTPDPGCGALWVLGLRGAITDLGGTPIEGGRPQFCARIAPDDRLVCLAPPMSRTDGSFTIVVPDEIRCLDRGALRVLAPGRPFAATYCPVDLGAAGIVALTSPLPLAPIVPLAVPPREDASLAREVTLSGGLTITVAPMQLFSTAYEELAGARVAPSEVPCAPMLFDGAYAFQSESRIENGAVVRITNDDGLAPGIVVDLYFVGGLDARLLDGTLIEEAEWVRFGTATVSGDGTELVTDPGSELPFLSWIAWKVR